MKKIYLLTTILISFALLNIFHSSTINANTLCPSNMDPSSRECLDYLRKKLTDASKAQTSLQGRLKNEQYQQLSLQEKIKYIENQIVQTEKVIKTLEMEIAAKDIEIGLLAKEIKQKEDDLSLLAQEMNVLKETVNKRVTESYKYSFLRPLELFLDIRNIDTVLRKTKYLLDTREKDRHSLQEYGDLAVQLEEEEKLLALKRADVQIIRNQNEEENDRLKQEKIDLDSQKVERTRLLAESERREKQIIAELDNARTLQSSYDNAIMEYIAQYGDKMADYGWVTKGTWIGVLRNGPNIPCSTGTHLHFSVDRIGSGIWNGCGKVSIFGNGYLSKGEVWRTSSTGWKYYYIRSGSMRVPLGGNVILTGDESTHSARGVCTHPRFPIDITSTLWSNIPVYAAMDGNLKKGVDSCGDQYAVIENTSTGLRSAYFHLQRR